MDTLYPELGMDVVLQHIDNGAAARLDAATPPRISPETEEQVSFAYSLASVTPAVPPQGH